MSGLRRPAVLLLLGLVAGCGDGAGPGGGDGDGFMRATIDGQAWESDALPLENGVQYTTPGAYAIVGSKVQGGNDALSVVLSLFNIRGPGTYPLGMGGGTVGGLGTIGSQGGSWSTLLSGSAGTVTITTLTSDRIAGTFAFTAHANMDPAGAARTVPAASSTSPSPPPAPCPRSPPTPAAASPPTSGARRGPRPPSPCRATRAACGASRRSTPSTA